MNKLTKPQERFLGIVSESILCSSDFNKETVEVMINNSTLRDIIIEDEQFVGHYHPEYWAKYVLDEWLIIAKNAVEEIEKF